MSVLDQIKHVFRMCGHALTITVHDRLDALSAEVKALQAAKILETDAALLQASIHIIENLHSLAGRTVVEASAIRKAPEASLVEFLYSHVPSRAAIEINSRREIDAALRRAGYDVHAVSAGQNGTKSTASRNGHGPAIGLMTMGANPLATIREHGDHKASVIEAELTAGLEDLVSEMRHREYHWHLTLYRSGEQASYIANYSQELPESRGSVFFFRDYRVFAEAQGWCAAVLPRTYIKTAAE